MPHVLHIASVLYMDYQLIKALEEMFFKFLWHDGRHGVSKNLIIQPIDRGGIKMISITNMIKAAKVIWIKRLINDSIQTRKNSLGYD